MFLFGIADLEWLILDSFAMVQMSLLLDTVDMYIIGIWEIVWYVLVGYKQ